MRLPVLLILAGCLVAALLATAQNPFDPSEMLDGYNDEGFPDPYGLGGMGASDPYDPYGDGKESTRPARELQSVEDIDAFLKEDEYEPVVLGYFDEETNSDDIETFKELANAKGDVYRFGLITSRSLLEAKKYDGCALIVYPPPKFTNEKHERIKYRYPSKKIALGESLEQFLVSKSIPLVGQLTDSSESRYLSLKKPLVIVFTAVDHHRNPKGYTYYANRLRKLAKEYKTLTFAIADIDERIKEVESDFGFRDVTSKSTVAGIRSGNLYYQMAEPFSFDALSSFLQQFSRGEIQGREKVVAKPDMSDSWEGSAVVPLTTDSAMSEIFGAEDVMVEFYAPWCGHCKALKPEYKQAAEHFKGDRGVKFLALDATAHTVPSQFSVEGYPTLYFVPAGSQSPQAYEGERTAAAMIDFVEQHRATAATRSEL